MSLDQLRANIREFAKVRDWDQFHNPKNLAIALTVESAELLENFQWLTPQQAQAMNKDQKAAVQDEIGDVMICLVNLADKLGIDIVQAGLDKLEKVKLKYPIEKSKGLATKYTELGED